MIAGLDIIIVNWNTGEQLRRCLESVSGAAREGFELKRVVVVDNASSDGSAEGLGGSSETFAGSGSALGSCAKGLALPLMRNAHNEGFAAACNRAAAGSGADYLLFLNPDTKLFPDSLSKPVAFMESSGNRNIAVVGIQLIDERGNVSRSCARFPALAMCVSRSLGLHRLSKSLFPSYIMSEWDHAGSREVDHVSGTFYMVRRSVFDELGGFDERFFVYLEDLDFSCRMSLKGWKSYYCAEARAFHRGGGASERAKAERLFYSTASRILYALKHFKKPHAVTLTFVSAALEPFIRLLSAAPEGSAGNAKATAAAYVHLYRALPRFARGKRVYGRGRSA